IVCQFGLEVYAYEPVTSLVRVETDGFAVRTQTSDGERICRARSVVLAIGDMAGPRLLDIPGESLPHVSHYFEEPHKYFQRRVLIVGGKNSAVEAALRCHHVGADVTVSYRRGQFDPKSVKNWILPEIEGRIKRGEIHTHFSTQPVSIQPTHVTLASVAGGDTFNVQADFVLLLVGYVADMRLFRMAGARLQSPSDAPVLREQTMETSVPGLYAAGAAVAGTQQSYKLFIENCHIHVGRIVAALTGAPPPTTPPPLEQLET
ncbi:MAG: NAD(P)-binding domain-containing protein, partial [Bacteroidota bacterium]